LLQLVNGLPLSLWACVGINLLSGENNIMTCVLSAHAVKHRPAVERITPATTNSGKEGTAAVPDAGTVRLASSKPGLA
jgi:hypothetical protein